MSEYQRTLERELERLSPPRIPLDRLARQRDRKRRDQRIRAAVLGIAIAIAVGWLGYDAIRSTTRPADDPKPTPTPTPAGSGSLAYALDGDIFMAESDGSNAVKIADGRPPRAHGEPYRPNTDCGVSESGTGEYSAEGPIWSPDGRYLAYRHADCEAASGEWWDVVISDAQGDVVTSFPSEGWGIAWSPDSTRVAVWEHWGDFGEVPRTIGIYGLDGKRQMLLTEPLGSPPTGESDPTWSPDGESILLLSGLELPLDGSTPRLLPWVERGVGGWAYSPDGSRIALAVDRSFVIADADGSNPREVFGDWPGGLVWSPAGDQIAFTPTSGGSTQLRVTDVASGTVALVTEVDGSNLVSLIDFSPDGDRILFAKWEDDGAGPLSLWSVNTDGTDLRRLVRGTAWGDWLSSPTP